MSSIFHSKYIFMYLCKSDEYAILYNMIKEQKLAWKFDIFRQTMRQKLRLLSI